MILEISNGSKTFLTEAVVADWVENENTTAGTGDDGKMVGFTSVAASACAFFGKRISIKPTWNARSIFYITRKKITGGRLWDDSGHCVCGSRKTMIVPYDDFDVSPVVRLVISDNWHYSTVRIEFTRTLLRGVGMFSEALHLPRHSSCGRVTFYESYNRTTVCLGAFSCALVGKWRRIRGGETLIDR